jgi:hypothetical protein
MTRRALLSRTAMAGIGMPLLQAMMPVTRLFGGDPPTAAPVVPKRLCVIYVPHGMLMSSFTPAQTGRNFPLSPTLEPFAPLAGRFSVVGNLKMDIGAGIMHRSGEMFLTNEKIAEADHYSPNRLSMDRLVARRDAGKTLLPSLEVSLSNPGGSGLRNTVAFDERGMPLMGRNNPQSVFELLFGSAADPEAQRAVLRDERSILDAVMPRTQRLRRELGRSDQRVLEEYHDAIRETESYLQRLEQRIDHPTTPAEQGVTFDMGKVSTRMRTMLDLIYLAFRGDLTRVASFVVFKERADGEQQYPELGLVGEHHGWTHETAESPDPVKREAAKKTLSIVDRFHAEHVSYFLQRLRDTPEGNGNMLDNTLVLYGSALCVIDGHIHDPCDLPLVLAGGEAMGVRQGQHVRYEKTENLANLHLTLLQRLGVDCQQWKDSTRVLDELVA